MKTKHYLFLCIAGLVVMVGAVIANPFTIPFPDWHEMPEPQQQVYLREAEISKIFLYLGGVGFIVGLCGVLISQLAKKNK